MQLASVTILALAYALTLSSPSAATLDIKAAVALSFATQAGKHYLLEQSPDIAEPVWTVVGETITGDGLANYQTFVTDNQSEQTCTMMWMRPCPLTSG